MEDDKVQEFIDSLIQEIKYAESPESVTPEMVARILEHLNGICKERQELNVTLIVSEIRKSLDIGSPNGIAPLDENAKIPAEFLNDNITPKKEDVIDVVEIAAIVEGVNVREQSFIGEPDGVDAVLVYDSLLNALLLRHQTVEDYVATNTYYNNWINADSVSELVDGLRRPVRNKLYYCPGSGKLFCCFNGALKQIGASSQEPLPTEEYEFMTDEEIDALFDQHAPAPPSPELNQVPMDNADIDELISSDYVPGNEAKEIDTVMEDCYVPLTDDELDAMFAGD